MVWAAMRGIIVDGLCHVGKWLRHLHASGINKFIRWWYSILCTKITTRQGGWGHSASCLCLWFTQLGRSAKCTQHDHHRERQQCIIWLRQDLHITKLLDKFKTRFPSKRPVKHDPMELINDDGELTEEPYYQVLGQLNHICNVSRPDIAYALSLLSCFSCWPTKKHWEALQNLIDYIADMKDYALSYGKSEKGGVSVPIIGFSDSDYASDASDCHSQLGYIIMINGAAVSWNSRKISVVTQSSCESEMIAAVKAANEIKWIAQFLSNISKPIWLLVPLMVDNMSAISVVTNQSTKSKLKHINIKHFKIREYVDSHLICMSHVPTDQQTANIMTKALDKVKIECHRTAMGLLKH